jgi:hypothetical protein
MGRAPPRPKRPEEHWKSIPAKVASQCAVSYFLLSDMEDMGKGLDGVLNPGRRRKLRPMGMGRALDIDPRCYAHMLHLKGDMF